MMSGTESENRYRVLDGLRALAILLVIAGHAAYQFNQTEPTKLSMLGTEHLTWFLMNGWVGVHLFFVLSGFLITGQIIKIAKMPPALKGCGIWDYLRRRFCRIVPVYYLMMSVALIVCLLKTPPVSAHEKIWWAKEYVHHLFFLNDYYVSGIKLLYWSLAVEAKFYLIAPLIVLGLLKLQPRFIYLIFATIMLVLLGTKVWTYQLLDHPLSELHFFTEIRSPFHMALDSLIVGMVCAFIWSSPKRHKLWVHPVSANILFFTGTVLFLGMTAFIRPYFYPETIKSSISVFYSSYYFTLISVAFGLMLLGLLGKPCVSRLFESRMLRGIALISYSLYLVHILVISYMGEKAAWILGNDTPGFSMWLVTFTLTLAISIPFSTALYYFIEKPFIDWSKRSSARVNPVPE